MKLEDYIQLSGAIFEAVQKSNLFQDGKMFVDSLPKIDPKTILEYFIEDQGKKDFDLKSFIEKYFILPERYLYNSVESTTIEDYIDKMWTVLLKDMDSPILGTLIPLPKPHIVPGGRFQECFYWDSYFSALGLLECGKIDIVKGMVENFSYLIDKFGFIPNGNRIYFLSRSQPPFFSFLLSLLFDAGETSFSLQFYPQLVKEYQFLITKI